MKNRAFASITPLVAGIALSVALPMFSSSAFAGCSPACKSGETCRYEAAGGKYYCEASKSFRKGISKGGIRYQGSSPDRNGGEDLLR